MMFRLLPVMLAVALAACGGKTEAPVTADGSDVAAKAIADVDAAMAEARAADGAGAAAPAK